MPLYVPGQPDVVEQQTDGNYRWATVTGNDPLRIRLDGDAVALPVTPENVSGRALAVGARVWVQFYGRRILVLGAGGGTYTQSQLYAFRQAVSGGGTLKALQTGISWSERFIMLGAGRNGMVANGFYEITMPPNGTVVKGHLGIDDFTVSGGYVDAGSNSWWSLWYQLPPPGAPQYTDHTRWHAVGYSSGALTIPDDWVCVAVHNPEAEGNVWHMIDGRTADTWRAGSYQNGWSTFGNPYAPARYKKVGDLVICSGLVTGGTVGTSATIFNLPAGFRPDFDQIFTSFAGAAATPNRIQVTTGGNVIAYMGPAGTYWSLDSIRFIAEQ
jgi:hypothetical protein